MSFISIDDRIASTKAKISKIQKNIECVKSNMDGSDQEKKILLEYYDRLLQKYDEKLSLLKLKQSKPTRPEFPKNRS